MKPKLKPPGTKRSKLTCDILLSTSALKFNLRRYNLAYVRDCFSQDSLFHRALKEAFEAGAYTRPLFSST